MRRKNLKYATLGLILALTLTGCNKASSSNDVTTTQEATSETRRTSQTSKDSLLGEITAVTDNSITIALGTQKEKPSGAPSSDAPSGDAPSGDAPSGDAPSGDAPSGDAPSSDAPSGDAPSGDAPSGDAPSGDAPSTLDLTGEEVTVTVTDSTVITAESNSETTDSSLSDIEVGDTVSFTYDESNMTATTITVKSFGMGGNAGGKSSGSSTGSIELSGVYTVDGTSETSDGKEYTSTSSDENAVLITNGGSLTLSSATISKTGDTSSEEESNFYAVNSIVAAANASNITISDTTLTSDSEGSNAVFATGENSTVNVSNVVIKTTGDSSRGLDATYGGTVIGENVDITTTGAHCAALATDRGEGTITVTKGTLSTAGDGSPCIYSTGNITATDVTGVATGSQAAVIEGMNSITLTNCDLTGAGKNGVMLYQSTSGDAAEGTSVLNATNSKLTTTSDGPMFYVTNTDAQVNLTNTTLSFSSGILINAAGNDTNNWGTPGSNGGNLTFTGTNQTLTGDITCDSISTVALHLSDGSKYTGAIDSENTGSVSVTLSSDSIWNVTSDSYITSLTDDDSDLSNIISNGNTIYYDSTNTDNTWLNGQTISLSDGGKLTPMK